MQSSDKFVHFRRGTELPQLPFSIGPNALYIVLWDVAVAGGGEERG